MFRWRRDRADLPALLGEPSPAPRVAGLEHEFTVVRPADEVRLDFARIVHLLGLGRRHLDPDDPNAYRLPSGAVVTSDKAEAEIALAPFDIRAGFSRHAVARATRERASLAKRLAPLALRGYYTHLSIEVPEGLEAATGQLYVSRFGPAMMLATNGPQASGLRIRPRHRRLELCGDYLEGDRLGSALELAAGSVAACVAALQPQSHLGADLPPAVRADVRRAIERPGWFIDRAAIGLAARGGIEGTLRLADGGAMPTVDHVALADALARRALAIPIEHGADVLGGDEAATTTFGDVLDIRSRPGVDLAPVMVTWPLTLFMAAGPRSRKPAFVAVPREWLRSFLSKLDGGELDAPLARFAGSRRGNGTARSWRDVRVPGLFDAVGPRLALLPREPM
jgi:hypothetical protein